MTPGRSQAEIRAYNEGVQAVLAIAQRAAEAIARTSKRRVHEDFAITALAEVAESCKALLIASPADQTDQGRSHG